VPTPLLPTLTIARELPVKADVLVVGLTDAGLREVPEPTGRAFAKRYGTSVAEMAVSLGAKSAAGHTRTLPAAGDGPFTIASITLSGTFAALSSASPFGVVSKLVSDDLILATMTSAVRPDLIMSSTSLLVKAAAWDLAAAGS